MLLMFHRVHLAMNGVLTLKKNHHRKIKIINNTDPTKNRKWTHVLEKGKKLLFLIRNPQGKITKHLYFAKLWIQINTKQVRGYIVITISYSVVYMGYELCQLLAACRRLSAGVCTLCVIWGSMVVICQLHEAGWRLSVSYMGQDERYLSVTRGNFVVIFQINVAG
jgi:hypothetical protein